MTNNTSSNTTQTQDNDFSAKVREFLFENKVVIMFAILVTGAFFASGLPTEFFFGELFTRMGRNTFLVLALLLPVIAGLGLNFGIVIGAMAAQIAFFLAIVFGASGPSGILIVALITIPIAIVFGYLLAKLFNKMKGSEMIGGMIANLFANGLYQFLFLWFFGGLIPIVGETGRRLMIGTGVGVLNVIELGQSPTYMRQALDDISMLVVVTYAFIAVAAITAITIGFKLIKKQKIELGGQTGIGKHLAVLAPLGILYLLAFTVPAVTAFLNVNRLRGVYAVLIVATCLVLYPLYTIIKEKVIEKKEGKPTRSIMQLVGAVLMFAVIFIPDIYTGLDRVAIPVFTYVLITLLCVFIKWFQKTRLGQNMRTVGQDRAIATAAGINVEKTRIIAMIMSTVLAAFGQIILLQNLGQIITYSSHVQIGLFSIASLLVGGATVAKAQIKHAIMGVILFHSLFMLAPFATQNIVGSPLLGEYFRMVIAYGVIAAALVMHAWVRVKKRKADKKEGIPDGALSSTSK